MTNSSETQKGFPFSKPEVDNLEVQKALGFAGEQLEQVTGHYLLGNGYRTYNPVLMRFHSPDSFSPFDKGGINAYAYSEGDPINYKDPTGN
ncbi:RHS repeat-associated core domain-containing protein [Bacillus mycoides]|uniref:RHS repeat-associated core domain-containing protein n=1 Tax=Bacillus TaxID=1386 RepID=UPI0019134E48|nr:RHS repeat-associated core domain-containing protein [Bacillus sp. TH25]MBK5431803.1 RHS repeat-associated core domain-containing protein [Bacillus sp. TH25]